MLSPREMEATQGHNVQFRRGPCTKRGHVDHNTAKKTWTQLYLYEIICCDASAFFFFFVVIPAIQHFRDWIAYEQDTNLLSKI